MESSIQPRVHSTTAQQPREPSLSPEQFTGLWQKCTTNNPSDFIQYLSTLLPLKPSSGALKVCLNTAIYNGPHYVMMEHLITQHETPISGHTLIAAVRRMDLPISENMALLDYLLDKSGWDVNAQVDGWNTLLHFATSDIDLVNYLLDRGANPSLGPACAQAVGFYGANRQVADSGCILSNAVHCGDREVVELLVRRGAPLAKACPVHCAVETEDEAMLAKVLELGADVDEVDYRVRFGTGNVGTPLVRAVRYRKVDMVVALLENGASVHGKGRDGLSVTELVKKEWVDERIRNIVNRACAGG